jgi:hypothetical protein
MLGGLPFARVVMGSIDIPRRDTPTSFLSSRTFLETIERRRRTCPSPTPTGPPGLGSSSSVYVILTLVLNICMHFKQL